MISVVEQIKTDLAIHQIAKRMAENLDRDLRWSFPEGWRRWVCAGLGIAILPVTVVLVAVTFVREWSWMRAELDGWEWVQVVLKSIYLLIFAALWCWGAWEIFA